MIEINNRIAINYSLLIDTYKLSKNTVNYGIKAFRDGNSKSWECIKDGKEVYIFFDTIPAATLKKIPTEENIRQLYQKEVSSKEIESAYKKLSYAQIHHWSNHRQYYRDNYGMDADLAFKTSLKRAVWDRLMELHKENQTGKKGGLKKGFLTVLFNAYDKLYKCQYSCDAAFSRAVKTVQDNGIDAIVVDKRLLGSRKPNQKFDDRHDLFLRGLLSSGKAYNIPKLHQKLKPMCEEANIPYPSESWVKYKVAQLENNLELHNSRYGTDPTNKVTPHTSMQTALFADDQYQVDGWDLPFYYMGVDRNNNKRLKKMVLIAVKDACSKKIVGYSISRSENRLSLFEALSNAFENTGAMPFELVTDNHAYNETKEVGNFVDEAKKIGMTWTIDSNPNRKSSIERGFKDLAEQYCKDHYGYIGQGIRTKVKNGRSKQELIDKYQKSDGILDEQEIIMMAAAVVMLFNKTPLNGSKKSPDQLYNESKKPNRFELDLYERLRIFNLKTEYKISRGQINITVAGKQYEYQLPASLFGQYNNKKVSVRYESLDCIYLFDRKTDRPITSLKQKEVAHGALANQTPEDIEILNRHAGRLKGIKAQARKENEDIARRAAELDPAVYDILNRHTTPKDVLKMAEEDEDYRRAVQRLGVDLNRVTTVPKVSEIEIEAFKGPKRTRMQESPMQVLDNQIRVISPDEYE